MISATNFLNISTAWCSKIGTHFDKKKEKSKVAHVCDPPNFHEIPCFKFEKMWKALNFKAFESFSKSETFCSKLSQV